MATYTVPISIQMEVEAASREEAAEVAWQVAESLPLRIVPYLMQFGIHRPEVTVNYEKIALAISDGSDGNDEEEDLSRIPEDPWGDAEPVAQTRRSGVAAQTPRNNVSGARAGKRGR